MHLFLADSRIVLLESAALHLGQCSRHPGAFAKLLATADLDSIVDSRVVGEICPTCDASTVVYRENRVDISFR